MKKLILTILFFVLFTSMAMSADLLWDASVGDVAGYKVYTVDGTIPSWSLDVGNVTIIDLVVLNLNPNTYYQFYVTAYNSSGESDFSNMAEYTTPPYIVTDNPKPVIVTQIASPLNVDVNANP